MRCVKFQLLGRKANPIPNKRHSMGSCVQNTCEATAVWNGFNLTMRLKSAKKTSEKIVMPHL